MTGSVALFSPNSRGVAKEECTWQLYMKLLDDTEDIDLSGERSAAFGN